MDKKSKSKLKLRYKRLALHVKHAEGATQRHASRFILRRINNIRMVMTEIMIWLVAVGLLIAGLGAQYTWNMRGNQHDGARPGLSCFSHRFITMISRVLCIRILLSR